MAKLTAKKYIEARNKNPMPAKGRAPQPAKKSSISPAEKLRIVAKANRMLNGG